MATLLELWTLENNSKLAPPQPPATEDIQITQARDLLRKIRSAGMRAAAEFLDDTVSLPPTEPDRTEALEKIAWARQTTQSPDGSADALMRLALADAAPSAPVNTILTVSDVQIQNTVNKMVPKLAKGLNVSSR